VNRVTSYPLDAGGSLLIKVVEEDSGATVTRGPHPAEVVETVANAFESALEPIELATVVVASNFRNSADAPESVEVEFGLELAGQAGAFIASVSTEAQLGWTRSIENLTVSTSATNRLHRWVADRCPG
jgi:hypothetical protein